MMKLQHSNFIGNLSKEDVRDGFLSVEFTKVQFHEMNNDVGIVVAIQDGEVRGYLCGASCRYSGQFPILNALTGSLAMLTIAGRQLTMDNTFIYGPVCIGRSFRGQGVLAGLYAALKEITRPRYSFCILFIADVNRRSLRAHRKLGMLDLGRFAFKEMQFHILGATVL
jgi:hypothetical protein